MKIRIIIVFLLLTLPLSGCIESQEIERLDLVNARGVDDGADGLLETSLVSFQFTGQSDDITNIVSERGKTLKGALENAENNSVFNLAPGKTKLTIYGRNIAEKGIFPLLDTQARDARINDNMYLAVSNTTAKEIFNLSEEKLTLNIGQYLYELIKDHSHDHNFPRESLQNFLRTYHVSGQDNILPLFEINEDRPELSGVAVFRGDKIVGELDKGEGTFINLINRSVKEQRLELSLPVEPFKSYLEDNSGLQHEKYIETAYMIVNGKSKTKLVDEQSLSFQTKTNIKLRLTEISANIKLTDHIIGLIEKELEKEIKTHLKELLAKLQDLKADSFGYGRYYTSTPRGQHITQEEWHNLFSDIDVEFKVNVDIIRHGMEE